jgi:integrase
MPRQARGLSAAKVKNAKPKNGKPVKLFDGRNLKLLVRSEGSKTWSFVYTRDGKKREMGLGSVRQGVTLAKARELARAALEQHLTGIDPLVAKTSRRAAHANAVTAPTFLKAAGDYIDAFRSGWADGEAEQWEQSLRDYALPTLGAMPVASIDVPHIVAVLQPIWVEKSTTARRVRGRIERVLDRCTTLNQRTGLNPARWRANLDTLLPKRSKAARVQKSHPAMDYRNLGDFMAELRAVNSVKARALEFTIRCAVRAGETRLARWSEIDWAQREWTLSAARMKMGIEHRVPLDDRSIEILQEMFRTRHGDLIFQVDGAELGEDDMLQLLQRNLKYIPGVSPCDKLGRTASVHGFRATYKTWCDERTHFSKRVVEISMAHGNADKVEDAYSRAEFREYRRQLADAWGAFCSMPSGRPAGDVVAFIGREKHGA